MKNTTDGGCHPRVTAVSGARQRAPPAEYSPIAPGRAAFLAPGLQQKRGRSPARGTQFGIPRGTKDRRKYGDCS